MKYFITLVLVAAVFLQAGCFGGDKVRKAIDASARLAKQVENLQDQTEKAYRAGQLPSATALQISTIVRDELNPAVGVYADFVGNLAAKYPKGVDSDGNKVPVTQWQVANALFQSVEGPFRQVLVIYGALSPEQNAIIGLAIAAVLELIQIIRDAFSVAQHHIGGKTWQIQTA